MRCGHGRTHLCDPRRNPVRRHSRQAMPGDGRYAGSAPAWKPRMPRLNTVLVLNLVLMLLGATPAMAMAADPQVSTEVFVERGDNPTFELQQAPALVYSTALATPPDTFLQAPMQVVLVAQLDELSWWRGSADSGRWIVRPLPQWTSGALIRSWLGASRCMRGCGSV